MERKNLCAHRGVNALYPENTLPAFKAALGHAEEIELDLWPSLDGEIFVCHDRTVDRTTKGKGKIAELTAQELSRLGLPLFADVLALVQGRATINIHIKSGIRADACSQRMQMRRKEYGWLYAQRPVLHEPLFRPEGEVFDEVEKREVKPYDEKTFGKILSCIDSAGARGQVYITGDADVLVTARKMAPDLDRCCLEGDSNYTIVENAVKYGCKRVQFCKMYLTEKMLRDAKENHLICNLFWADDKQEAEEFLKAGIDVVLTNNCLALL